MLNVLVHPNLQVVAHRCSTERVFLEIWHNSQKNACARVSFLIKLHTCNVFSPMFLNWLLPIDVADFRVFATYFSKWFGICSFPHNSICFKHLLFRLVSFHFHLKWTGWWLSKTIHSVCSSIISNTIRWIPQKDIDIFLATEMNDPCCRNIAKISEDRSSHWMCLIKKSVLKNFANFTGKHLCQSLFNKFAGLSLQLY